MIIFIQLFTFDHEPFQSAKKIVSELCEGSRAHLYLMPPGHVRVRRAADANYLDYLNGNYISHSVFRPVKNRIAELHGVFDSIILL